MRPSLAFAFALLLLPAAPQAGSHRVQSGDTLITLAAQHLRPGIGWQRLQAHNRVRDPLRLVPGSIIQWPDAWSKERPTTAELLQVQGEVWRERAGAREALSAGAQLADGDVLASGAQASAVLRFADGTRSLLRGDSRLSMVQLRALAAGGGRSRLQLEQGALETQVPPGGKGKGAATRFELQSPLAHLGVRGTQFRTRRAGDGLQLEVLEGSVAATEAKKRAQPVDAGQGWQPGSGRETLLAAPDLSGLQGKQLQRLPLALSWPALAGAAGWQLDWWSDDGSRLLFSAESAKPLYMSGGAEIPDGDYRLRLRARSASGLQGQEAEARLTVFARPEPPLLQSPAPAAKPFAEEIAFAWTKPADAAAYHLQVAEDAGFTRLRHDLANLRDTGAKLALPIGVSHWRVASRRADGRTGPWGDAQQLERLPPPPAPPPPEPARDGNQLSLRWAASALAGARYQVQIAETPDFAAPWHDSQVEQPSVQLELLKSGTQHLRLRTLAPDGTPGPWGTTQQLEGRKNPYWWLFGLPLLLLL